MKAKSAEPPADMLDKLRGNLSGYIDILQEHTGRMYKFRGSGILPLPLNAASVLIAQAHLRCSSF